MTALRPLIDKKDPTNQLDGIYCVQRRRSKMDTIQAYYNGSVFVPITPVNAKINQPAIITILETENTKVSGNSYDEFFGAMDAESYKEIMGALKDTERVDVNEW